MKARSNNPNEKWAYVSGADEWCALAVSTYDSDEGWRPYELLLDSDAVDADVIQRLAFAFTEWGEGSV